jgi:hypothetical protein
MRLHSWLIWTIALALPAIGCGDDEKPAVCGDGVVAGEEECDDGAESAACNADCTVARCGDGIVNETAGEDCEPTSSELWARCSQSCFIGSSLDGTFGAEWEPLAAPSAGSHVAGLQSFHYAGMPYIYEFTGNRRYVIASDEWQELEEPLPWTSATYWVDAAVDASYLWVARDEAMHVFTLESETWDTLAGAIPDGSTQEGATIYDGAGYLWYHGPDDDLIRYDPADGTFETFTHDGDFAGFDVYETRLAYDPITNAIAFTGFENDRFLVFDIDDGTFHEGAPNPGGRVCDNTCQDRSGGVYAGTAGYAQMYRYDIAEDTWTILPDLPALHDNNSNCVVSEDGFLYFATDDGESGKEFYRLPLGKR